MSSLPSPVRALSLAASLLSGVLFLWVGLQGPPARAQEAGGAATKANLDLPFDALGENDEEEEEAPEVIVFYGQQYEGDFFCFAADKSKSMDGAPWKKLQQEVSKIITGFSERVQFGIVFFDASQVKFPPSGRPADASPAMKSAAISMVMSTTTSYGSCYKEALVQCLLYAQQSTARKKQIIVLGDGQTTCNGQDQVQYGRETLAMVSAMNTSRAHINTLGIGSYIDEEWLRALAAQNNGSYRRVQ